ncbi:hypothetical protein OC846_001503 [Tilletia horrida]|uniref:Uncharacterized protein n=1 Tax=Tilletia horrida TaxID=155126 RepID=A0AAN6GSU5_9BASI|nr:hypothetical protein OC845_001463 [Tilletia horrida]KAK0555951.1 hypothetical protein OC846_001503 [Tilletia horrida]
MLFGIVYSLTQLGPPKRGDELTSSSSVPPNSHTLPGGDKARFDSLRSRTTFSLRPTVDSPRSSRPHSRAHSPSASVTSAARKTSRTRCLKARTALHQPRFPDEEQADGEQQHHAYQSLSFADRIVVQFRTSNSTGPDGDDHMIAHDQTADRLHDPISQSHPTSGPKSSRSDTSSVRVFQLTQILSPTTDEERALRKIYDDLLASRAAEAELSEQFAAQSTTAAAARASLETALETLRSRRKADDAERASLRSRVKVLDEERRLAEAKKREVEKKLESWSSKVRALEKEWEDGQRAQTSAKDTRLSLRDGWKRREEVALRRKVEVEKDIESLLQLQATSHETHKDHSSETISPQRVQSSGKASKASPKSSNMQTPGASTAATGIRDHNNAKAVRDRIKTLEGQIKKERERLERVKRSAQTASVAAGTGPAPAKDGGKGRQQHGNLQHQQNRQMDKQITAHAQVNNVPTDPVSSTNVGLRNGFHQGHSLTQPQTPTLPSPTQSTFAKPLQALQPYSDLQLPTWVRSSVFGEPSGLPSFVSHSDASKVGNNAVGGSIFGGKSAADTTEIGTGHQNNSSATQLPWEWPAFRTGPLMGLGNGGPGFGSNMLSPATGNGSGSDHGRTLNGLFGSSDGTVLPLHTSRSTQGVVPTVSVSAAANVNAAPTTTSPFLSNESLPVPATTPTTSINPALTPIKITTPRMGGGNLSPDMHSPSLSTASGASPGGTGSGNSTSGGKLRPRTNAPRRRARTPVSPYSAGLLPRNLLSYADDDEEDEMAALNEMESAWASLEEEEVEEEQEHEGRRA